VVTGRELLFLCLKPTKVRLDTAGGEECNPLFVRRVLLMDYEIRVFTKEDVPLMIHACAQASDYAAIRKARALASDADRVEVWCGPRCIFAEPPRLS
jgi:hypothetical protein